jgi:predicted metal-dependent phosphotriesterase family hydrolase
LICGRNENQLSASQKGNFGIVPILGSFVHPATFEYLISLDKTREIIMKINQKERRHFLKQTAALSALAVVNLPLSAATCSQQNTNQIMTVNGPLTPEELGTCLHHEHIVSRFGEDPEASPKYDYDNAMTQVVPYLKFMQELGCKSIMCCTTKYFGRDVKLLQKISESSGMHLICNTGFYGAANDRYVPEFALQAGADEIAALWIDECNNGIDGSNIKPGFIKVGIDNGPLSDIDAKLVRAGAICHKATGLTLQVHTGDNSDAVRRQLSILREEGVAPSAWVWIHAQNVKNADDLLEAAEKGAWISLDALRTANYYEQRKGASITVDRHLQLLLFLKSSGYLKQALLSHDGSSYPQQGKSRRTFEVLFTTFIPMMKGAGFSDEEIDQLIIKNPAEAYKISKRLI